MNSLLVRDVMAKHPPAIVWGTPLTEVVSILLKHRMTGLPVIDADERVVGFVSEQDCLRTLLVSSYHAEGAHKVEDVMRSPPLTVSPDDSVVDVAQMMVQQKPKLYPVVNGDGRLAGLLMRHQVLVALKDNRSQRENG